MGADWPGQSLKLEHGFMGGHQTILSAFVYV